MRSLGLAMSLLSAAASGEDWTPPENPDPQSILHEAQADAKAKCYELALAKHVWFHEHALETQPAMYGVRLSFALGYWHELAKEYPPALKKLEDVRDDAARAVKAGENVRESFHDMASINRELGTDALTKDVFESLDGESVETAQEVFGIAQPALIKSKAYALCGKYVKPEKDFRRMKSLFETNRRLAGKDDFRVDFANRRFAAEAATLVGILAANERLVEAEKIAEQAKAEWSDKEFHAEIDSALNGTVPAPWP